MDLSGNTLKPLYFGQENVSSTGALSSETGSRQVVAFLRPNPEPLVDSQSVLFLLEPHTAHLTSGHVMLSQRGGVPGTASATVP